MDIRKLQRVIVDGLEDVKAQNIQVFNTEHLSPLFERVIVASGTSNRQTQSLAASVRDAVKAAGEPPPRTEGEENGEWIIVDCGPAVVHVMQPAVRDYYHLEELWGEKPVKLKLAADRRMAQASEPIDAAPGRRTSAKGAANPAGRTSGKAVAKTAARKAPAKTAGGRAATAKKATARAPAGKTAARKTSAASRTGSGTRRPAAKKAPPGARS